MSDVSLILQAAEAAAGHQQHPGATLYVVATPIGNVADLGLRAVHLLARADAVACEDTRVTAGLLQRLGLHRPLLSVHEHNEVQAAAQVIARLDRGERVAYVSDAGTPAISDPGARLVAAVREAGFRVVPLPGPSSVAAALSAAGDAHGEGFRFVGFLPPRPQAREQALRALAQDGATTCVLFEAPHRIEAVAEALAAAMPARRLTVCRELTKQFEQIDTLDAAGLPAWLAADDDRRRGEFVLVLHAAPAASAQDGEDADGAPSADLDRWLQALLGAVPLRQAVDLAVQATGGSRQAIYRRALALRDGEGGADATPADAAEAAAPPDLPPLRRPAAGRERRRRGG